MKIVIVISYFYSCIHFYISASHIAYCGTQLSATSAPVLIKEWRSHYDNITVSGWLSG